jgi:hypothetical protein
MRMAAKMTWMQQAALAGVLAVSGAAMGQASPAAVPVPFATDYAGTGVVSTPAAGCTGIATTTGASYGDGCPAAGAGLYAPQGAALDKYGNVYVADYSDRLVRVIYNGGTQLAAAITAANSGFTTTTGKSAPATVPVVGDIYTIAGLGQSPAALTVASTDGTGKFACANYATTGQPDALNSLGDGCPAAAAVVGPRDVTVDGDGNLFLTDYTNSRVRVLCVDCSAGKAATALIELEEPGVTPVNGAMYTIAGYAGGYRDAQLGFGNATIASSAVALLRSPTGAVVSASDDVYIADNTNNAVRLLYNGGTVAKNILTAEGITPTLGYVYTIAGAGCVSAATTKTGSVVTANSCLTTTGTDAAALGNTVGTGPVWTVYLDANQNVYYTDGDNERVKVIYGGVAAPLTLPNAAYSSLAVGDTYSFAGQGSQAVSGVAPSALKFVPTTDLIEGVGGDAKGNIFFTDYNTGLFYETFAQTGLAWVIGGGNAVATASAAAGVYCNGGTAGPAMTDAFYNGCPLTQAAISGPRGPIVEDASGDLYFADSPGSMVRKLTFHPVFPATGVGATSAPQPYAFTFDSAQTLQANETLAEGAQSSEFKDAGGDTCAVGLNAAGGDPGTTCVVNVAFTPAKPGLRDGAVLLTSGIPLGVSSFEGVGTGASLTVDPGTQTTTGTGLTLQGIAVTGAGNAYVTNSANGSLDFLVGSTVHVVATGLTAPSGVAVDGASDVFVADAGANVVKEVPADGPGFTLVSGLSSPHGLATDGLTNVYIADTGNNRVVMINAYGTVQTVLGFSGLNAPVGVALDAAGSVYVADSGGVKKLTTAGVQTTVSAVAATGVAVDAAGDVFASTATTVVEYPLTGSAVTVASGLGNVKGIALDGAGDVYIADATAAGYVEVQRTAAGYKFTSYPASTTVTLSDGGNLSLTQPTYTQTDAKDFSLAAATTNGCSGALSAGANCALTASFAPTAGGTLMDVATFTSNAANASPITLTLTGTVSAQATTTALKVASSSLIYGNVQTLTATVAGTLTTPATGTVNFYSGTTLLGSASVGAGGAAVLNFVPAVGSYQPTATFVPGGLDYAGSTSSAGSFSVQAATLTVTANNASKVYNTANPAFTYAITGFVNGDTAAAVSGTPVETTTATTGSALGTYPITITAGTLSAANCVFTFVNGTLTVTGSAAQAITFGSLPGVTYGVGPIALGATSNSGLAVSYTVTGPATIAGSTLTVTGAGMVTVTANQAGNNTYAAATPVPQSFTVAKASLTVTATSVSKVYGSAIPTLTYGMTGFVNGDSTATATTGAPGETTTAATGSSVGGYPITLTMGTLASNNYTFTLTNGTLTVTPATLMATANNATRLYGAANPAFSGTLTGAVNNDSLTETFATTAAPTSAAGTYAIVPGATGTNVGNYTLAATNGTLTVTAATPGILLATTATSGFNGATSITLTATLSSPTSGTPTGMVTFYAGTTAVGTATIASGMAMLTTTALPVGSDSVTAVYAGDGNFSSVTSTPILITIAAGFGVTATSTALAFPSTNYEQAQTFLNINPGGQSYTLTFGCTGLPAKLSCAFSPATVPLTGVTATQTVQLLVSNSNASASLGKGWGDTRGVQLAGISLAGLLLCGLRRRKFARALLVAVLALAGMAAMSGCGTSPTALDQGAGTYSFNVVVSSGSTTVQTIPFTLTVP